MITEKGELGERQERGVEKSKGEYGTHFPSARGERLGLLPKPRCGSLVSVTCVISRSGSAIKPFVLLFCGPRGRNKAPRCASPPNYLSFDTKEVNRVLHTCVLTHTQYREWITEHAFPIPLAGSECLLRQCIHPHWVSIGSARAEARVRARDMGPVFCTTYYSYFFLHWSWDKTEFEQRCTCGQ